MVLLKRDKEQQLRELATVVTGIRLFNRAGGAGGEEAGLRELSIQKHVTVRAI